MKVRLYDTGLIRDVAAHRLPVTICVDRCGDNDWGCIVFRHAHGVRLCFTTVFECESCDILQLTEEIGILLLESNQCR